jgi:hypothetical protein
MVQGEGAGHWTCHLTGQQSGRPTRLTMPQPRQKDGGMAILPS